jgi:hypothetical protein
MTIWQNLKINSTSRIITPVFDIYKALGGIILKLTTWIVRFFASQPPEFIKTHIHQNKLIFSHIKNQCVLVRYEIDAAKINPKELNMFLEPRSTLPLHVFIDNEDVNYKLISLRKNEWWSGYGIFNQIRISEFDAEDWIYSENIPSPRDLYRHIFIGFKPSPKMLAAFSCLTKFTNPIAKIQLTSVQETAAAIHWINENKHLKNIQPWSVFIRRASSNDWILSAYLYDATAAPAEFF